jgi:uncharacterized membrane protein
MDLLLWAVRVSHVFAITVWLGALLYQAAVLFPLWNSGDPATTRMMLDSLRRFLPFQWMGLTTVLVTGICLMLFSPRFIFFSYHDWWSVALGLKQVAYLAMTFFALGLARMVYRAAQPAPAFPEEIIRARIFQFNRNAVFFGIIATLLAVSMV